MNPVLARSVARHALAWLAAANAVGVLLAALLLWPQLNRALAPFTYGRWMPLHLDWQLYGWCSLPLIGALLAWMLPSDDAREVAPARWALRAWSIALAAGGVSWLGGVTSGKLFLDWSGWARPLLPVAMTALWSVVAAATWSRRNALGRGGLAGRMAALAALLPVPAVLYWSAGRAVYPSINPDSGGATGAALLGSTLALVAIAGWLPHALGLGAVDDEYPEISNRGGGASVGGPTIPHSLTLVATTRAQAHRIRRLRRWFWGGVGASAVVFFAIDRGHASHHAPAQIVALGTLLVWAPLLAVYYRGFAWRASAWRWLQAAGVWWTLLLASGWLTFWPGVSERFKFTDVLVAHAHLAMAGAVTSLGAALLAALGRAPGGGAAGFWAWQLGLAVQLVALVALGVGETTDVGGYFVGSAWVTALLAVRLAAGIGMFGGSLAWLKEARP